jgi:hypothetical protein
MTKSEIVELTKDYFDNNLAIDELEEDDYWVQMAGGYRAFYRELKHKCADPVVDACCMHIGVDETSDDRDIVEEVLAKKANAETKFCPYR